MKEKTITSYAGKTERERIREVAWIIEIELLKLDGFDEEWTKAAEKAAKKILKL